MFLTLITTYRGEFAALGAALIWAIASIVYSGLGRQVSPLVLNLLKGLVAIAFLVLTLVIRGELLPNVPVGALGLLLLSGVFGIGIGDTAYFQALNLVGPRRSLVLESLSPVLAALLAFMFLQESLSFQAWAGMGLTIVGVLWVVVERTPDAFQSPSLSLRGIGFGVLAAMGQAVGAVLSRSALAGTAIDPLWSTLVRLMAGILVLLIWLVLQRRSVQELKFLKSRQLWVTFVGTAFASTYLAIWLQQTSLKYAVTGISQSLSATSPLFITAITIALGDRVSLRAVLGVFVSLGGIWLLFSRG